MEWKTLEDLSALPFPWGIVIIVIVILKSFFRVRIHILKGVFRIGVYIEMKSPFIFHKQDMVVH